MYNEHMVTYKLNLNHSEALMSYCAIGLSIKPISVHYKSLTRVCRGHIYTMEYAMIWQQLNLANKYQTFTPINFK